MRENGWGNMKVQCLPPALHNDPGQIVDRVRDMIREKRDGFDQLLVLFSDCGTGGGLQQMLDEEGVEGVGGAHCYEVFAGDAFAEIIEEEPGCFFVTDFLARNFERLVFRGLGLDRFPNLRQTYFGNYEKLVHLAQTRDPELRVKAEAAAQSIGLDFEYRYTSHGRYESFLRARQGCP